MKRAEYTEALNTLLAVVGILALTPAEGAAAGVPALRNALSALAANAAALIKRAAVGAPLLNCFVLARAAGPTFATLEAARVSIDALDPVSAPALAVKAAALRMTLAQQARVLAATVFVSRDDVDAALASVNTAFGSSVDFAADYGSGEMYQWLTALHASVIRDLTTRGRPLPRMATYAFKRSYPSLVIANRLYGDASRSDELVLENKIAHPLFAPLTIRALSA